MILLKEFQTKAILAENGIRIPKSKLYKDADSLKRHRFTGPAVLKAQTPVSSRWGKGLVRFAAAAPALNREASALRTAMKRLDSQDEVLIEDKLSTPLSSAYLAVVSDPAQRAPVILYAEEGGTGIEEVVERDIQRLVIAIQRGPSETELLKFFASPSDPNQTRACALTNMALKLYDIYRKYHAVFLEVNPCAWTGKEIIALDAKMAVDEDALSTLTDKQEKSLRAIRAAKLTPLEILAEQIDDEDYRGSCHFAQTDVRRIQDRLGNRVKAFVGFDGVGTGVSLTAMDELVRLGYYPRNFCDTSGNPPASKLYRATRIILSQDLIRGYFFMSCVSSQQLHHTARGIVKAFLEVFPETNGLPPYPAVLVFRGAWEEEAQQIFRDHGLTDRGWLRVLPPATSERQAARAFDRLYKEWKRSEKA